jgi:hypothetical protein|nr:MAG TPA: hypothetical protein [Caudoviricetes sp.]
MCFAMMVFHMAILLLISVIMLAILFGCAPIIAYIVNWIGDKIAVALDWLWDIF